RLYTAIPPARLILLLESVGLRVLLVEEVPDQTRPGIQWINVVGERGELNAARGLERIEAILAHDRKTATYKLALLRALCAIARNAVNPVEWGPDRVYVPLRAIAVQWLIFYWPIVTAPEYIAQIRGEHPGTSKPIAFRTALVELAKRMGGPSSLYSVLRDLDKNPRQYDDVLKIIAQTIRKGPVTHSGSMHTPIFTYRPGNGETFGWVGVPTDIWLDICRFEHWIEDSIIVRWARLTDEINRTANPGRYLALLMSPLQDERDTFEVRQALSNNPNLQCVWTGKLLQQDYAIDHVIPYAVWGNNDLWNLLPAHPQVNQAKSDALPARSLLIARRMVIIDYWQRYAQIPSFQPRFATQIRRALNCDPHRPDWPYIAFAGLEEIIERTATTRGLPRWSP
uniref:HNH endonuclease domain-containing protein n=1 Tax=Chloroflexus sp. TaxID=1904827 RepID=UPI002ACD9CCC